MAKVYVISDLHIGHNAVIRFSSNRLGTSVNTIDEHDQLLIDRWNSVVTKRDVVWVLGDICFDKKKLPLIRNLNGQKNLILGNHDKFKPEEYLQYFHTIKGPHKYKGFWISHIPMHPSELWDKPNIHGHVHDQTTELAEDTRYINVTVEALKGLPVSFEELQDND